MRRARVLTVCLAFTGVALLQRPGLVAPDTKLDLTADPLAFLGRALTLWEPTGFAGQVQNQAYGYLFPMGPFFALGHVVGLPEWVVQRLWLALLLSVAFVGVVALTGTLRVGTPTSRLIAAVAYALAPRAVSELGPISVEVLPMALAPWVLTPLVHGARRGSPRRAAALSGLAVFCVGGVNAVATLAVLPLPALWLLTRGRSARSRALAGWWVLSVALATAWWIGPLLLLGRVSPPFLDWIETAKDTTGVNELVNALRGTSHWIAWLGGSTGPEWPAGWTLAHDPLPVLATAVVAAIGLAALTRSDLPYRRFLVLGALTGLLLLTAGHVAAVDGLFAPGIRSLLDGALAPLRNIHKFDPVLRLPLVVGLAHVLGVTHRLSTSPRGRARTRALAALVPLTAVVATAGVASPVLAGQLVPPTAYAGLPGYWEQTASWLAAARPAGRALLVPASSFGTYTWGSPSDEPLQALASTPWDVRDAVPLTPAGHIRMLDAVEARLAAGEGSAGLVRYLARSGVSYLVVRNDLDAGAAAVRPALVHRALADSPGLRRVATFGPDQFTALPLPGILQDAGLLTPVPAIEVFAVPDAAARASVVPLDEVVGLTGGPDALLQAEDEGLVTGRPTVAVSAGQAAAGPGGQAAAGPGGQAAPGRAAGAEAGPAARPGSGGPGATGSPGPGAGSAAAPEPGAGLVVGDALRRRERSFGRIDDAASATLAPSDPLRLSAPARDYLSADQAGQESTVRYSGIIPTASDSASDPGGFTGTRPEDQPFAAVDGDPTTAWRPATRLAPAPATLRLALDAPLQADAVTVMLPPDVAALPPASVVVTTDAGARTDPLLATTDPQPLALPRGTTRTVAITATVQPGRTRFGLAEVGIPGARAARTVVVPSAAGPVRDWVFDAAGPARSGCVVAVVLRCAAGLVRGAEEPGPLDRTFTPVGPSDDRIGITVTPRPGAALDALIAGGDPVATADEQAVPDPRAGAGATVDGDPATAWLAAPDDPDPTLTLRLDRTRRLDHLQVVLTPGTAAARPTAVQIDAGSEHRTVALGPDGTAGFAPLRTNRLTLRFPASEAASSHDPATGAVTPLGIGVSEVAVDGLARRPGPDTPVTLGCGQGPTVTLGGQVIQTALTTTVGDLRDLRPVPAQVCGDAVLTVDGGKQHLVATAPPAFTVSSVVLAATDPLLAVTPQAVPTPRWDAEERTAVVPASAAPQLLVVPENTNPGWTATVRGQALPAVTVDGWQQGWMVPAGPTATVTLSFGPGRLYRDALAVGAGLVLVLALLAAVPARRRDPRPACRPSGRVGRRWTAVAVVGSTLLAGPVGLGALGAVAVAARFVRRDVLLPGLAAAGLIAAGIGQAAGADPTDDPTLQVLCSVAVAAVLVAALVPVRAARPPAPAAVSPRAPDPAAPESAAPDPAAPGPAAPDPAASDPAAPGPAAPTDPEPVPAATSSAGAPGNGG